MHLTSDEKEAIRQTLCSLQSYVLKEILAYRFEHSSNVLASISEETAADTIYVIDKICDAGILDWLDQNWPAIWPVQIIMEGLNDAIELTFPRNTPLDQTRLKCIIDPIDGTRGIMYDKRAAWILAGIAPQKGNHNTLADIEIAAMTEIPTTRQWRADQISAIRGGGIKATAFDTRNHLSEEGFDACPSQASTVHHAFATIIRYFPAGSSLLSQVEETLWERLCGKTTGPSPQIFNDQYISSGGHFYELLSGHDRFVADLRPLAFEKLGIVEAHLSCHPYDVATALILQEAGCIVEKPCGAPLDHPLDTTTPVSWVAYANKQLAANIRPVLQEVIRELL